MKKGGGAPRGNKNAAGPRKNVPMFGSKVKGWKGSILGVRELSPQAKAYSAMKQQQLGVKTLIFTQAALNKGV